MRLGPDVARPNEISFAVEGDLPAASTNGPRLVPQERGVKEYAEVEFRAI
ncbi:hypothetical protein ACFLQ0_04950 [Nitrospinota bacterium]